MDFDLPGILLVVFIVLKLVGVITWSWIWVLAPFWIPFSIGMICYLLGVILMSRG